MSVEEELYMGVAFSSPRLRNVVACIPTAVSKLIS